MDPLTRFVRSLGNDGALANAQRVLDARRHEDWLVDGLARRLASRTAPAASAADPRIAAPSSAA